jgi:uncharacterized damage-inducible protein DinB
MYAGDYYTLMTEYGAWMNRKLFSVSAEIPDAKRKENLGAFFGSLHRTLNHILFGDLIWLARFTGGAPPGGDGYGEDLYDDFDALRARREAVDIEIIDWTRDLDRDWLAKPFSFTSIAGNVTRDVPAWAMVTHMFNHQTHHRGQATTLIKQLGRDPGVTDIPFLPALHGGSGG